jgi:hypothetical protein
MKINKKVMFICIILIILFSVIFIFSFRPWLETELVFLKKDERLMPEKKKLSLSISRISDEVI